MAAATWLRLLSDGNMEICPTCPFNRSHINNHPLLSESAQTLIEIRPVAAGPAKF